MTTYYARTQVPVKMDDGRVVVVPAGGYFSMEKVTAQVGQHARVGSIVKRDAPEGVSVIK